jgi:hypothetical protein
MANRHADLDNRPEPAGADDVERIERRRQPRDSQTPPNWEAIVLKRMAGRVRSLSGEPALGTASDGDGGWEEAALLALRRRMKDLDSI